MEKNLSTSVKEIQLKMIISKLSKLIPFQIYVQNSKIIYFGNQKFIPIIFLTKCDYYKMIIKSMYKIYNYFKSPRGIKLSQMIKIKNLKFRSIITQSGKTIFQIGKPIFQIKKFYF